MNPDPDAPPERLSATLLRLREVAGDRSLSIREMVEILQGRGWQMIVILLCLPFLSPVTIPGISLPFGLAIALCGVRIAFRHKPWLPRFLLDRTISPKALEKMVNVGCAIYGRIEKVVRPRLTMILDGPGMFIVIGLSIAVAGLLLSLPIPPPFPLTNTIPGLAIILLSLGLMERDGILILIGYGLTLVACVYVAAIAMMGRAGALHIWRWFSGE